MVTHLVRILSRAARQELLQETQLKEPPVVPAYLFARSSQFVEYLSIGSDATVSFPDGQNPFLETPPEKESGSWPNLSLFGFCVARQ